MRVLFLQVQMAFLCAVFGLAVAKADQQQFTASAGAVLPAPEIDHLTCREMQALLSRYSNSSYRGTGVVPGDHPDRPIYDYENRLAETHYQDCQSGSVFFESSAPAFGQGFN